jgi:branched-chain amino acid transport system substrate-binding protein
VVENEPGPCAAGSAVKAGGLTPSTTPSPGEIVTGLQSLKGDTLDGWSPPLTFAAGQPHKTDSRAW